jgi:hypothetical protein
MENLDFNPNPNEEDVSRLYAIENGQNDVIRETQAVNGYIAQ